MYHLGWGGLYKKTGNVSRDIGNDSSMKHIWDRLLFISRYRNEVFAKKTTFPEIGTTIPESGTTFVALPLEIINPDFSRHSYLREKWFSPPRRLSSY